ncbi:MAG TPA: ATP-binding protein [Thermoanaerobaculia bacterium]
MKLSIAGASHFVNRMFEACGNYQWARELLRNSLEAQARRIEFGIDWQAVRRERVWRRTVADDGGGMDRRELLRFFSTLGEGAKRIGGIHENFGVGAKIATLPWNPEGVVVLSYKHGKGAMIWIALDEASGDYELVEFETETGKCCVVPPGVVDGYDWAAVKPEWIGEHGTVVALLGSREQPHTVLGNVQGGEKGIKGLSVYLNSRFWDLTQVEVRVEELRRAELPPPSAEMEELKRARSPRVVLGARHYLTDVTAKAGRLRAGGVIPLAKGRVAAEWYLWEGERPAIETHAKRGGYLAVRYGDELFQITSHKAHFRWFGVIENQVQQNLTIVLEPQHYRPREGRWGVHPDQSRNRLIFTGDGEKGVEIPLSDWGLEFAQRMPAPILEAIRRARGGATGSIEDEEYRRRLQDRFGSRWTVKLPVAASLPADAAPSATLTAGEVEVGAEPEEHEEGRRRRRAKAARTLARRARPEGADPARERQARVDVPRYRLSHAEEFEEPWHLALWAPHDPDGPTVLVNVDSPILQEIVEHHQEQYPDVYADEVAATIRQVFGEIAACKVAHAQKLTREIPEEELDRDYRSEQALTVALMGLLAEETVIAQRLVRLGRKKPAREMEEEGAA